MDGGNFVKLKYFKFCKNKYFKSILEIKRILMYLLFFGGGLRRFDLEGFIVS